MAVQLRDKAIALEPAVRVDRHTGEETADWDAPPASQVPVRFQGQPLSSTEEVVTAETIIARWRGFLAPSMDGVITTAWRIRWDDQDYLIEGDVERHKKAGTVRYLSLTLKRVTG